MPSNNFLPNGATMYQHFRKDVPEGITGASYRVGACQQAGAAGVSIARTLELLGHRDSTELTSYNSHFNYRGLNLGSTLLGSMTLVGWHYPGDVFRAAPKLPSLRNVQIEIDKLEQVCDTFFCVEPATTPQLARGGSLRLLLHTCLASFLMHYEALLETCTVAHSRNNTLGFLRTAFVGAGIYAMSDVAAGLPTLGAIVKEDFLAANVCFLGGRFDNRDVLEKNTGIVQQLCARLSSLESELELQRRQRAEDKKSFDENLRLLAASQARAEKQTAELLEMVRAQSALIDSSNRRAARSAVSPLSAPISVASANTDAGAGDEDASSSSASSSSTSAAAASSGSASDLQRVGRTIPTLVPDAVRIQLNISRSTQDVVLDALRLGLVLGQLERGPLIARTTLEKRAAETLAKAVAVLKSVASVGQRAEWANARSAQAGALSSLSALLQTLDVVLRGRLKQFKDVLLVRYPGCPTLTDASFGLKDPLTPHVIVQRLRALRESHPAIKWDDRIAEPTELTVESLGDSTAAPVGARCVRF